MSSIVIAGDTSGSVTLQAPAVSGSSVLSLPAVTDTVAGIAATQTLTNKTLVAPALGTPVSGNLSNCTGIPTGSAATPTALGTVYGLTPTAGAQNVSIGYNVLNAITTGVGNVGFGLNTLQANTTGQENSAFGGTYFNEAPLKSNTTGSNNSAYGAGSLRTNTTGSNNVAYGTNSLQGNTTASNNTAVGYQAGNSNTTGTTMSAVGYQALYANTTGADNTAMGDRALKANTTGTVNCGFGYASLFASTTGNYNTGIGGQALFAATTGNNNTAVGYQALVAQTTSNSSVALGNYAGLNITTGNENLMLGYDSGTSGAPGGSITTQSNRIVVGSGRMTNAYIQIAWTVTSDARDKTDVVDAKYGLNFVNELRPVEFKWDKRLRYEDKMPNGTHKEAKSQLGFLAQDVIALEKKYGGIAKDLLIADDECDDLFSITETKMIPVLVKAIQELKAEFDAYKASHP